MAQCCHIFSLGFFFYFSLANPIIENFQWEKLEIENLDLLLRHSVSNMIVGDQMFLIGGRHEFPDKNDHVKTYNFSNKIIEIIYQIS